MSKDAGMISPAVIAIIVVVLVGIVASVAITVLQSQDESEPGSVMQIDPNATYVDGEYRAVGTYVSPGGLQTINLTVTLKDNVIIDTSLRSDASGEAKIYVDQFIAGYEAEVIGKPVNEVDLSRVAGSSLTSTGFNEALNEIRDQARS